MLSSCKDCTWLCAKGGQTARWCAGACCLTGFPILGWLARSIARGTIAGLSENSMEKAQYIRGPADPAWINLDEEHELVYWTKLFGESETKLRAAVAFAGVMASDVRDYLHIPTSRKAAVACIVDLSDRSECCSLTEVAAAPAHRQVQANTRPLNRSIRFPRLG